MVVFPNAKINIGLQVLQKRPDNYHELETVFYPIKLYDALEVIEAQNTAFFSSGISIDGNSSENSCMAAYHLLSQHHSIPPLQIHLHKNIPIGAGLGGGSSDAASMIKLLDEQFELNLSVAEMQQYARSLGADCSFFIRNEPVFATGIGDMFTEIALDLSAYHFVIVKPDIQISTQEAYREINTRKVGKGLFDKILDPMDMWGKGISNDFETVMFRKYDVIRQVKDHLYLSGAEYAAMSGSGAAVFGIFKQEVNLPELAGRHAVFYC